MVEKTWLPAHEKLNVSESKELRKRNILKCQDGLKRSYIELKYYADAIHSDLTPPG